MQLREVVLPEGVRGRLFLHGMPGRRETLDDLWRALRAAGVGVMLNLTSDAETRARSPEYAEALARGTVPCDAWRLPMIDDGGPGHEADCERLLRAMADGLRHGRACVIHCNAGVGRTGTAAAGVLLLLGVPLAGALKAVHAAGSAPVTLDQRALLTRLAARLAHPGGAPLV
jgi:protein-tyrosine phosphatase